MGWSKATKLEGRKTAQGLVALVLKENRGAMVEINCETDFVARNQNFKELADKVAKACLQYLETLRPAGEVSKVDDIFFLFLKSSFFAQSNFSLTLLPILDFPG